MVWCHASLGVDFRGLQGFGRNLWCSQVEEEVGNKCFGISLWAVVVHNLEQNKNRTLKNVENR